MRRIPIPRFVQTAALFPCRETNDMLRVRKSLTNASVVGYVVQASTKGNQTDETNGKPNWNEPCPITTNRNT